MTGQTVGPRSYYTYTSDGGTDYSLLLDDTLAAAAGLTAGTTAPSPPRRFSPRVVLLQATVGGRIVRKRLVVNADNALYQTDVTGTITIDGVSFGSTGRVGEKATFPRND